jgi:hypothetical protein
LINSKDALGFGIDTFHMDHIIISIDPQPLLSTGASSQFLLSVADKPKPLNEPLFPDPPTPYSAETDESKLISTKQCYLGF